MQIKLCEIIMPWKPDEATEEAREAARIAREEASEVARIAREKAAPGWPERLGYALRRVLSGGGYSIKPYKLANYDKATDKYHVIGAFDTFAEAYNHPDGTHVIQTHGTSADVERQVRGEAGDKSAGANIGKRAGIGWLVAGPLGAAVGAASSAGGDKPINQLPTPIITAKHSQSAGVDIVYDGP
jgi:hypothetical protein